MRVERPSPREELLRYRFDSVDQVSRHFHVTAGRVLLFYPTLSALLPGAPVILDVTFAASNQHCLVKGAVVGRGASSEHSGCWLEFAAWNLVASLRSARASPKRRQRRFPANLVVSVQRAAGMPAIGKLVDIALTGGRVAAIATKLAVNEPVQLSLRGRDKAAVFRGRVAWTRGSEFGFELLRPNPDDRAVLRELVEEARHAFDAAYEAVHPSYCRCAEGYLVAEPPLPRVAHKISASS